LVSERRRTVRAEGGDGVGEGLLDPVRGLVEDQGAGFAGEAGQALAAGAGPGGEEAFERETVAGQPGHAQRGDQRAGPGDRTDPDACGAGGGDQPETGVADQRRAGVGHQGQRFAAAQARDQALALLGLVVFVQRDQALLDAVMGQQLAGVAGVLGADRGHSAQGLQRPRGEVAEMADRGGDDVQHAGDGGGRHRDRLAVVGRGFVAGG
jgi:hypothetical protein